MKSTPLFTMPGIIARSRCVLAANAAPFAAPGLESTPIDRRFSKKDRRSFRHSQGRFKSGVKQAV